MRTLFLLMILLAELPLYAQERRHIAGHIQMTSGGAPTSFYLEITITGDVIEGFSVTGYEEGNRLQAAVAGRMEGDEMSFEERAWPGTPAQAYCYFSARLKAVTSAGFRTWSGTYTGRTTNGSACDGGTMTITESARELVLPKPAVKKEDSCLYSYDWKTDSLTLDVWDGWTIDGDVISLAVNNAHLLDHKKLSDYKEHFNIVLQKGLNVILVSLHEEGFDPPNTPNMVLYDGDAKHELQVSGTTGQVAKICIWRR